MGRGYDAGKRTKGMKRHIVVDTLGLLMAVVVHTADIQDRDRAKLVLKSCTTNTPACTSFMQTEVLLESWWSLWLTLLTGYFLSSKEVIKRGSLSYQKDGLSREPSIG